MQIDRQRYETRQRAKQTLIDQGMYLDVGGKEDEFLDHQEAQNLKLQFAEGKLRYGPEFDEAFEHLTSLNAHNPRNRAVARTIVYASYGGGHMADTLIGWYRGQQGGGRRSQQRQSASAVAPARPLDATGTGGFRWRKSSTPMSRGLRVRLGGLSMQLRV